MKTDLLFQYLKCRAQIEGVEFKLDQTNFFEPNFYKGIRNFFGVLVDDDCFPFFDEQEPNKHIGLLYTFLNLKVANGSSAVITTKDLID